MTLEAVDARTGAGIEGVRFQYETDTRRRSATICASQLVFVDHPDDRRAAAGCGRSSSRAGSGSSSGSVPPGGNSRARRASRSISRPAGRSTVRWSLHAGRRAEERPRHGPPRFPRRPGRDMAAPARPRPGREVPHPPLHLSTPADDPIPPDELEAFLDANDLGQSPTPPRRSRPGSRPEMPGPSLIYEIIDGRPASPKYLPVSREDARATSGLQRDWRPCDYDSSNGQADIFDARKGSGMSQGFPTSAHLARPWPAWPARTTATARGTRRPAQRREPSGRLTIDSRRGTRADSRWVVDPKTGFVHADSIADDREAPPVEISPAVRPEGLRERRRPADGIHRCHDLERSS